MPRARVLFVHGQESGPQGTKARRLAQHFRASTPAMDTSNFDACVAQQADAIRRFQPDVVVGSSFGGAVALALLQRGLWQGPTLLLAPALAAFGLAATLPEGVPVWIVHGSEDDVVPIEGSRALAGSGTRGRVRLLEREDDHRLSGLVASGGLETLVRELAAEGATGLGRHVAAYLEDSSLWPVTFVVLAHVVLAGALILIGVVRNRSIPAMLALALVLVLAADAVRRSRRRGRALAWLVALSGLSAVAAFVAARLGVL